MEYIVTWRIKVEAKSYQEAADIALANMDDATMEVSLDKCDCS